MYRQILIHEDDKDFQRILFRTSADSPVTDYNLKTVTFGVNCAPYLAIRTLHQLADDTIATFPLAATILKTETYVDDILSGSHDIDNATESLLQVIKALKSAGFILKKLTANHPTTTARAASANHQIKGGRNASVTTAGGSIQRHRRAQQQQQQHIDNNGCAKQHRSKAASQPPHCSGNTCINVASVAEAPATHQGVGINRGEHPGTKARNVNNSSAQHQQQQLATSTTEARNNTNNESTQHQRQQQQQCPYQGLLQQGRLVRKVKIKRKKTHLTTRGCDFKCNKIHRASKSTVQVKATATSTTAARNNTNNSAQRQQRKRAIPATTTTAVHLPWPAATWGESFGPIYTHLRFYMYAK
ncbi:uncharacterized protein LOC118736102 [Rhagoletis pomonella]|uniref:uncharacterized protein LOC118736102 n=1 Tax=Rhagoletis pomonella TaxID=28610 RepID=UPI001786CA8F|nr:uncharacterized protein LOC118736102 [Rhagoletis pomonella]